RAHRRDRSPQSRGRPQGGYPGTISAGSDYAFVYRRGDRDIAGRGDRIRGKNGATLDSGVCFAVVGRAGFFDFGWRGVVLRILSGEPRGQSGSDRLPAV